MIKYEPKDLEKMQFIDPHVIQPTYQVEGLLYFQDFNDPNDLFKEEISPMIIGNNIQMEQYINLDDHLSSTMMNNDAFHTIDELNTPIFEAGKELHVKNMQENKNPFIFPIKVRPEDEGENQIIMDMINTDSHPNSVVNNSDINNSSLLSPNNTFNVNITEDINLEEYDLLSDYNDAIINDISCVINEENNTVFNEIDLNIETPEASTSSEDTRQTNLRLDLENTSYLPVTVIETPDVINTIDSIEKDFNLFGQLHAGNLRLEEIKQELPSVDIDIENSNRSTDQYSFQTGSNSSSEDESHLTKKRRRTFNYEDDDEDYIPPKKEVRSTPTKSATKGSRRGRPPKDTSVSPMSSTNSKSSKYREMRDKNNEASRKSRQKRKVQEVQFEQERDELEVKNIQLKAQVHELENSINRLRGSLIEIMLKK